MSVLNFKDIFAGFIDANQKEWGHNRSASIGASEVFGCERQAWLKRFGVEAGFVIDDDFEQDWGATKRGDLLEEHFVVPAIRDHLPGTAKLIMSGKQQKTLFHQHNSATPDGIILGLERDSLKLYGIDDIGPSNCVVFEIKSIDPRVSLDKEKDIHYGQVQTQIGIIRAETEYKPDYGIIIYVDASFLSRIKVFAIKFEEKVWSVAKQRATKIMTTINPIDLTPEGKIDGGCDFCPWSRACMKITTGSIPDDLTKQKKASEEMLTNLEPYVKMFRLAQRAKKEAEADYEDVKSRIKDALRTSGSRKLRRSKEWTVTWYQQAGQRRVDLEKIKEALGVEDLDDYKTQGDPFDVLKVTLTAEVGQGEVEND